MSTPSRSGVFGDPLEHAIEQFTESISVDHQLASHDITGSIAHAHALEAAGILTAAERQQMVAALEEIGREFGAGKIALDPRLEDIHMHVEHALVERLGDLGRKLHTGRSRNDQVSTDLRLWVRDAIDRLDRRVVDLQRAFVGRCERDRDVVVPGYTHWRRAQPVLASHVWLAYCEKFERDRLRLAGARRQANVSPLGAAALAGTSFPIDRAAVAERLGFAGVMRNSLDAVSDRDFVIETVFACAMIALHLSGWAEEWIVWSTSEFGFLQLPDRLCTGSSIMPQKINPDLLELVRGKAARVAGNLQTLTMLIKGLPLAYNRDLQEDKPPLMDAVATTEGCLGVAAAAVEGARLVPDAIAGSLATGYLDATTLMEHLIGRGIPQRRAHQLVGQLVRKAAASGTPLGELPLEEFRKIDSTLDESVYDVLGPHRSVAAYRTDGSSAPELVDRQVRWWQARLEAGAPPSE